MLIKRDILSDKEKNLLNIIQSNFPIENRPYRKIGQKLNISEEEALSLTKDLKKRGIIRRLGAIFDYKGLGYKGTLVAAKVEKNKLNEVAEKVNRLESVTHNYARQDDYNLWFTLIAESEQKIFNLVEIIKQYEGVEDIVNLPALNLYKINVSFDFNKGTSSSNKRKAKRKNINFCEKDKKIIVSIQEQDFAQVTPFKKVAGKCFMEEKEVFQKINKWVKAGVIRRFGAAVAHQRAGIFANGMVVFNVGSEKKEEVGSYLASLKEVTHCYERPSFKGWPYNLYAMVHGSNKNYVIQKAEEMAKKCAIKEYKVLFSLKEFKKSSLKYFKKNDGEKCLLRP